MEPLAPAPVVSGEIPVVLNAGSGAGRSTEEGERLQAAFREAGLRPRLAGFEPGEDVDALVRRILQ